VGGRLIWPVSCWLCRLALAGDGALILFVWALPLPPPPSDATIGRVCVGWH
jgi:hypothetical protein